MNNKKRAHKTLSLLDKIKILDGLKQGKSGKDLANQFGVGRATISDIKKKRNELKRFVRYTLTTEM